MAAIFIADSASQCSTGRSFVGALAFCLRGGGKLNVAASGRMAIFSMFNSESRVTQYTDGYRLCRNSDNSWTSSIAIYDKMSLMQQKGGQRIAHTTMISRVHKRRVVGEHANDVLASRSDSVLPNSVVSEKLIVNLSSF